MIVPWLILIGYRGLGGRGGGGGGGVTQSTDDLVENPVTKVQKIGVYTGG